MGVPGTSRTDEKGEPVSPDARIAQWRQSDVPEMHERMEGRETLAGMAQSQIDELSRRLPGAIVVGKGITRLFALRDPLSNERW